MIQEYFAALERLSDENWEKYVFSHEPLANKLSVERRRQLWLASEACGHALADELLVVHGNLAISDMARRCGAKISKKWLGPVSNYTVFAQFTEPDELVIYADNAEKTDRMIDSQGLRSQIGDTCVSDILLAHELYHFLDYIRGDLFTSQKHILLWTIGPIKNESRVGCLEEIGAMAFAKRLCGLSFKPYIMDVLMLYSTNPQRAKMVYDSILAWSKVL